jgi:FkbM family methyltransferase
MNLLKGFINNLLIRNIEIYRQVKLLRPAIGALFKGNVKPLIGYFRYLNLKIENKEKLFEFSQGFEDLKYYVLYYYFDAGSRILSLLALEKSIVIEFPDKCKFFANRLEDYVHAGLYNELKTFNFIKEKIKNARVFADVGANIGGYSIRAAKYCKVYAIEPLPRNYKILKINEKLNNVKINSFNLAVGKERGKVKLYYDPRDYGIPSIKRKQNYFIEVEMKPLDEIINEESIDLIKIDVEGAEDLVLEGARNCLKRTKMVIIERSESFPKAYRILKEENFKLRKFLDHNVLFTK